MAALHPFRALRPLPAAAARIAAVPYDVVSADEARRLAEGNPLSFLRVSRAEIELPAGTDPYSDPVYQRAARNFTALRETSLALEEEPSLYLYRLRRGEHTQTGIAGCFSLDEYDCNIIKKHERTRRDKEDDRTRHMLALGAQTGPVFLTYRAAADVDRIVADSSAQPPLFDFTADDGVRHTMWRVGGRSRDEIVAAFARMRALYIADGHHRAASAARARRETPRGAAAAASLGDGADVSTLLAVAFPHDQALILPYNRVVRDLGGMTTEDLLRSIRARFEVGAGLAAPARRGDIAMFVAGVWYTLRVGGQVESSDPIGRLDVSILQERLLGPVLGIADVRTDKRIDFVGGARGTAELERMVASGQAAVAFSMYPVSIDDLMAVADAGEIMPPKSTWFEPKLRDGLLIHLI